MSLLEPIEQIIGTHHAYLRRELPVIFQAMQSVAEELRSEQGIRLRRSFDALNEELHKHMLKEEVLLFPSILEVERCALSGSALDPKRYNLQNPLVQMESEHQTTIGFLTEIKDAGAQLDWQKNFSEIFRLIRELEIDLLQHIKLEEESLFVNARNLYLSVLARHT